MAKLALIERIEDSLSALALAKWKGSVHIESGQVGQVVETDILKGTIKVRIDGEEMTLPGRRVATLDECLG
jgi:hypothetical protein